MLNNPTASGRVAGALLGLLLSPFAGRALAGGAPALPVLSPSSSPSAYLPALPAETAPTTPGSSQIGEAEVGGIAVEVFLEAVRPGAPLREGEEARVRLEFKDANTKAPLDGLFPGAWIDALTPGAKPSDPDECKKKLQGFVGGSLLNPPEHDLNAYFVLGLNEDATITVVDPLFTFGGSKLLDMVFLKSAGSDWTLSKDQLRLYVSMAEAGEVAVVDTESWKVIANVPVGQGAGRVMLQPDERYLWVAVDGGAKAPGVVAIDTVKLAQAAAISTGTGPHDLAISLDDRYVFASSRDSGDVSVIDVRTLSELRRVKTCKQPVSIAWSEPAGSAFVACQGDGAIVSVSSDPDRPAARLQAEPGLAQIRFSPDGRLGFVPNPKKNVVHIVDASGPRIIQSPGVESEPDQVSFSQDIAYVRHRGSETILMIPLSQVGHEGAAVPVVDFPGGQNPAGRMDLPTLAAGIVQAPGEDAILLANPQDRMIYYYKEGMAAPMGSFQNYSRQPRAVLAVDRSLRPAGPGRYSTTFLLGPAGRRDLTLLVNSPRMVGCFPFTIEKNPNKPDGRPPVIAAALQPNSKVAPGKEMTLRFRLNRTADDSLLTGASDVRIVTFLSPGVNRRMLPAAEVEPGVYEARFTPTEGGIYYVFVESKSAGLRVEKSPATVIDTTQAPAEPVEATGPIPEQERQQGALQP
ncbi:MAG: cytochrome D1 domain-containing protein [Acidobacteriota bacterium]